MEMDRIDKYSPASVLDGYLVRKDLVRTFSRQFPVPTYVVEFLLGRYCASIDTEEIEEGIKIAQRQLADKTVKAGDEELLESPRPRKGRSGVHRPDHCTLGCQDGLLCCDSAESAIEAMPPGSAPTS